MFLSCLVLSLSSCFLPLIVFSSLSFCSCNLFGVFSSLTTLLVLATNDKSVHCLQPAVVPCLVSCQLPLVFVYHMSSFLCSFTAQNGIWSSTHLHSITYVTQTPPSRLVLPVLSCLVLPCRVFVLSCPFLPCLALSCLVSSSQPITVSDFLLLFNSSQL
jgi:hypothetical protein